MVIFLDLLTIPVKQSVIPSVQMVEYAYFLLHELIG